jgi:hypothetical protein
MTAGQAFELELPLVLPELLVEPSAMQVFMFSAVTWNRHHIHYSRDAAVREGHADVVVQRALLGNFFARHAQGWLGAAGSVRRLAWKVAASALPGQRLCCRGAVTGRLPGEDELLLRYESDLRDDTGREIAAAWGVLCVGTPC